jgi:hypothetical protein
MDDARPISHAHEPTIARSREETVDGGRLTVYAALGALTGAVPLPWIPDSLARRVRGAMAHDIAARHGLSLEPEARRVLAEPATTEQARGLLGQAARFIGRKVLTKFGPLAVLPPVQSAVMTFVFGHLFARYLETTRTERAVRIDADEARRVRQVIDRAIVHAVRIETPGPEVRSAPEELRDPTTAMLDTILNATAGVPAWLVRRLEAAFDALWREAHD